MTSYIDIAGTRRFSDSNVTYTVNKDFYNWEYDPTFSPGTTVGDILGPTITGIDNGDPSLAQNALALWSAVAALNWTPVTTESADIGFLEASLPVLGRTVPFESGASDIAFAAVVVNKFAASIDKLITYLHEIGHALGLTHPGGSASDGSTSGFNTDLTIMSYNPGTAGSPVGPMAYDIAAIQAKYGANFAYNAGGTLYDVTTDSVKDASTIWDGGGNDTLDASAAGSSVTLDLRAPIDLDEKYMSDAAGKQFFVAYGANIENAIGSSFADTLIGNDDYAAGFYAHLSSLSFDGANHLEGRGGNDILIGGGGADTLDGGDDIDWVSYAGKAEGVTLTLTGSASSRGEIVALSGSGSGGDADGDQLMNVEVIEGGDGNDTIQLTNTGKESANTILGGLGDDTIIGNEAFFSGGVGSLFAEHAPY